MTQKTLTLLLVLAVVKSGMAVKCYHCYDLHKGNGVTVADAALDDKLVKCSEKQKDWNSRECPPDWPACVIMSLTSEANYQVVRTCAAKDFCSLYVPADGVRVQNCRECETPLCNDVTGFPNPSNDSQPLFTFNVNLHVNKYRNGVWADDENPPEASPPLFVNSGMALNEFPKIYRSVNPQKLKSNK